VSDGAANIVPMLGLGANSDPTNHSAVFEGPLRGAGKRGKKKENGRKDGRKKLPPPLPTPSPGHRFLVTALS